jgi:DNA processing protein
MSAVLAPEEFTSRPISPLTELGAYEALWKREGASFKSIAELFRDKVNALPSDFVTDIEAQKHAQIVLRLLAKAGVEKFGVRVHGAGEYPERLRDAWHPIEMLYYQGWWDLINHPRLVAIVGTRNPSDEGIRRARKLVNLLVKDQFGIVSGLAKGIDTVAHTTAIESKGMTIAVIGTPINTSYPPENAELQRKIADKFLLISQIPVFRYSQQTYKGNRLFFPERNITMSALTEATIIVEAGETSGTLTQARAALAQKRKLFILDSCFKNPTLTWPKRFQEQGAIRVSEYEEIKAHLGTPSKD